MKNWLIKMLGGYTEARPPYKMPPIIARLEIADSKLLERLNSELYYLGTAMNRLAKTKEKQQQQYPQFTSALVTNLIYPPDTENKP